MQLVSVAVPSRLYTPPPVLAAELPLTVQSVSVAVPPLVVQAAAGVAAVAELPLTVQLVSVRLPPSLYRPPPLPVVAAPGDRQSRDRRGDAPVDLEHPARPAGVTVTPAFGPMIVSVPVVSLSSSWPRVRSRVIVCGVLNTVLSKVIVWSPRSYSPGRSPGAGRSGPRRACRWGCSRRSWTAACGPPAPATSAASAASGSQRPPPVPRADPRLSCVSWPCLFLGVELVDERPLAHRYQRSRGELPLPGATAPPRFRSDCPRSAGDIGQGRVGHHERVLRSFLVVVDQVRVPPAWQHRDERTFALISREK